MYAANSPLDTGTGVNPICLLFMAPSWTSYIKRKDVPQLQTATKKLLHLDKLISVRICLGELITHFWLQVALHLAVEIFLVTHSLIASFA